MTSRTGESTDDLQSKVEQQQERIDELEQTMKKMMPSRRDMLKGGAVAGAGLLGFGAGQASASGHNDGDTQWGSDTNRDDYFADHINAISVDTDELSTITVVSPGDDLQSRIDAAEPGGVLFFEEGTHDVATMGAGIIDKPITVIMSGGNVGGATNPTGAVLENAGSDVVDSPVLTIENPTIGDGSTRPRDIKLYNLNILHEGGTTPAVTVNDVTLTKFYAPRIDCNLTGDTCLELTNETALTAVFNGEFLRFTNRGFYDNGTGGRKLLNDCNIVSGQGSIGAEITSNDNAIIEGQLGVSGGTGVHLRGEHNRVSTRIEDVSKGVVIDDSSRVSKNTLREMYFATVSDVCVEFGLTAENEVINPVRLVDGSNTGGAAVRWTGDSVRDRVAGRHGVLTSRTWDIASGATRPTVQLDPLPVINDTQRGELNPVEGMRIYNQTDANLNIYDGGGWILPDGTAT